MINHFFSVILFLYFIIVYTFFTNPSITPKKKGQKVYFAKIIKTGEVIAQSDAVEFVEGDNCYPISSFFQFIFKTFNNKEMPIFHIHLSKENFWVIRNLLHVALGK